MSTHSGPGPGLGARIRQVRLERNLSVRELARRVERSPSLISQIERGVSAPSAGMIYQLATELRTSLDYLFGVEGGQPAYPEDTDGSVAVGGAVSVTRHAAGPTDRRSIENMVGGGGSRNFIQRPETRQCIDLASGVRWERLSPSSDPFVDFLEVIYQPKGNTDAVRRALRHDGREYGLVLNGRLRADVGFETYDLAAGDSIVFDSSTPHVYWNETDDVVHAIWMIVHHEPGRA